MLKTMAARFFVLSILIAFSSFKSSEARGISVYWGQNASEGSLWDTCSSGLYRTVKIAYLTTFGNGQEPVLDLGGHCYPFIGCIGLGLDIRQCQTQGIRVLLSIGGSGGTYNLSSPEDAKKVASYLWTNYLAGNFGPLGFVALDGIDFAITRPATGLYWDDLAKALLQLGKERKIYLSASVRCLYPDPYLQPAIRNRRFDSVSIRFYNNLLCDFDGSSLKGVLSAWNTYNSTLPNNTGLYLGLPAASDAVDSGYMSPEFVQLILPLFKLYENYEGVSLWNRYYDLRTSYSEQILPFTVSADIKLKLPSEGVL